MDNKLYLYVERHSDKSEFNSIYTHDELFGYARFFESMDDLECAGDGNMSYLLYRRDSIKTPEIRLYDVDMTGSMEHAAQKIAQFVSGAFNSPDSTWENDSMRTSVAARKMLSKLMQPIMDADFGDNTYLHVFKANEYRDNHADFVNDLDKIYSELGILSVERLRPSVTQGEARVNCNGRKAVQYGDEIWMQRKDGTISHWDRAEPGPLYGPIIGGYGSKTPDERFRTAALVQYRNEVYKLMQETPLRDVEVWQLGDSDEAVKSRFLGFDRNLERNGSFNPQLYEKKWSGQVEAINLEDIYYVFNMAHPDGYNTYSLSVSDVVKVDGDFYFCDSIGFRKLDDFTHEVSAKGLDERIQDAQATAEKIAKDTQQPGKSDPER